jgi:hypothetical protein
MGPNGQTGRDRQARADRPENSDQRDLVVLGGQSAMSVCLCGWSVCARSVSFQRSELVWLSCLVLILNLDLAWAMF